MQEKKAARRVLSLGGSIMAFHVGSGFASGQEILQFYTAYGLHDGTKMCALSFFLFSMLAFLILEQGRSFPQNPVRLHYLCLGGTAAGGLFYRLTPLLSVLVLTVTVAGAGAAGYALFGLQPVYGRILISAAALLCVLAGLKSITDMAGNIGPIIIVCVLCLGGFGLLQNCAGAELWRQLPKTSATWQLSAVSYVAFGTVTQVPFLLTAGKQLENRRQSFAVALTGNGCYMLAGLMLHLGMCRSMPLVFSSQLPALRLAFRISRFSGAFYGIILLFSIFTTAVPMLWSVCVAISSNEKSTAYRTTAVLVILIACVGSYLPFDRLLGTVYPYIGYLSAGFFAVLLARVGICCCKKAVQAKVNCQKFPGR